jgi:hypothetical protein
MHIVFKPCTFQHLANISHSVEIFAEFEFFISAVRIIEFREDSDEENSVFCRMMLIIVARQYDAASGLLFSDRCNGAWLYPVCCC